MHKPTASGEEKQDLFTQRHRTQEGGSDTGESSGKGSCLSATLGI